MEDKEIFDGKMFSGLIQDIYINSTTKKAQIDLLTSELATHIKDSKDAALIVPLIKDYLEVGVRNDDLLIKLAGVVQKHIAVGMKPSDESMNTISLSEKEKEEILRDIKDSKIIDGVKTVEKDFKELTDKLEFITEDVKQ